MRKDYGWAAQALGKDDPTGDRELEEGESSRAARARQKRHAALEQAVASLLEVPDAPPESERD